jgi:hypothetical protein
MRLRITSYWKEIVSCLANALTDIRRLDEKRGRDDPPGTGIFEKGRKLRTTNY